MGTEILFTEIMSDIIDEIRRERKIAMTIRDANYIKEYIQIDLDQANIRENLIQFLNKSWCFIVKCRQKINDTTTGKMIKCTLKLRI